MTARGYPARSTGTSAAPADGPWKLGRVLATGNCVVLKLTEQTPLTPLRLAGIVAR